MKRAIDWFQDLPEQHREQAIKNTINYGGENSLQDQYGSLRNAICCAFSWVRSPEGIGYWSNAANMIFEQIKSKPKNLNGFGTFDRRFINFSRQTA